MCVRRTHYLILPPDLPAHPPLTIPEIAMIVATRQPPAYVGPQIGMNPKPLRGLPDLEF